jgi:hypothetical protein
MDYSSKTKKELLELLRQRDESLTAYETLLQKAVGQRDRLLAIVRQLANYLNTIIGKAERAKIHVDPRAKNILEIIKGFLIEIEKAPIAPPQNLERN